MPSSGELSQSTPHQSGSHLSADPVIAYLGIGGNLGDTKVIIQQALTMLSESAIDVLQVAPFYKTEPVEIRDVTSAQWFLNTIAKISTHLSPHDILKNLQYIENLLGRVRPQDGSVCSRTIDLDLLFYGDWVLHDRDLQIPHPRMHTRSFVLAPFLDVAPNFVHPVLNQSIRDLASQIGLTQAFMAHP